MRIVTLLIVLLSLAGVATAENPEFKTSTDPFNFSPDREAFYSQLPATSWGALNASSGFEAEMADDIPATFAGMEFNEVTFFHAQWGGVDFVAPDALVVTVYDEACPPGMDPSTVFVVPYAELETELLYSDSWYVYACKAILPAMVTITDAMSIGAYLDNPWGIDPPYNGLCYTDEAMVAGCDAYRDGAYWGWDRWTSMTEYFGYGVDLAYVLGTGTVANEPASWGTIKSLYR